MTAPDQPLAGPNTAARDIEARIVTRDTAVSTIINTILSVAFFLGTFGVHGPVTASRLGPDFFPQAFMVTLMGTAAPCLLLRSRTHETVRAIATRSFALAVLAALAAGGLGFAVCWSAGAARLSFAIALAIKALFGAMLSVILTPVAVRRALRSGTS